MRRAFRRWWEAPDPLDAVERHLTARADATELLHLGALLDALPRAAREHIVTRSDATRLRLDHACQSVELWATGIAWDEVRTTALYCAQQCRRTAGPIEEAAPESIRLELLEDVMWAWSHAQEAIRARARELDALRGRGD